MAGHDDGNHDDCNADTCFAAKMRYLREGGNPALFQYKFGKQNFHGPTINERAQKIRDDAAREGRDIRPVNPRYDRVGI